MGAHIPSAPIWFRWWFLLPVVLFVCACGRDEQTTSRITIPPLEPEGALMAPVSDVNTLSFPTRQTGLAGTNLAAVFQPTASGNPESGTYGSVRLGNYGKSILPRFHEGLDIAALERDRHGRPLDDVHAAMRGRVAMVNRTAGNSDYGIYVVLLHEDPVGTFYTLYAHLAEADARLREGNPIEAGARIGRMGNSALEPIPMSRAHLHFEVGLLANDRFLSWPGLPKKHTPGGKYNGQNLWGLNPILLYRDFDANGGQLSLLDHIHRVPVAFEILVISPRVPDYFVRYPSLWQGGSQFSGVMVLAVSEGGVVLSGRPASPEEASTMGRARAAVLRVDEFELGRNARRIVVKRNGRWEMGIASENWLGLFLH